MRFLEYKNITVFVGLNGQPCLYFAPLPLAQMLSVP